jgi:acetoin utilization deacetylase AcuC-like enzyme
MTPRVGLFDDPVFREHDAGRGHPERPERLDAIRRGIREAGLEGRLALRQPRDATPGEILRVHTGPHLSRVAATQGRLHRFDPDTQAGPRSYAAAVRAAGAALEAVDSVLDGDLDRAFCTVRPPGHHAEAGRAMGFCLFNNVAVAAAHALARGLRRVAIVDWDVHHGNGTQAIFEADPRVLYVSSHEYPFYPGSGSLHESGEGAGRGFTVNLPLPAGLGDPEYSLIYREIVRPIGRSFDPELVLVSAGFDPYRDDPLAGMRVSERGFADLTQTCLDVAEGSARGRLVAVLEGGYHEEGLARAAAAVVARLLGEGGPLPEGDADPRSQALCRAFRSHHVHFWPVLGAA